MKMARLTPPSVAFRHHGAPKATVEEKEGDQSLRWWEQPLPLKEKKAELAPRISLDDLLILKESSVVVIDTRNEEDYLHGHYPGSLNVHIEELNDFKGILLEDRKKYFIVLSDRGKLGPAVTISSSSSFFLLCSNVSLLLSLVCSTTCQDPFSEGGTLEWRH